MRIAITALIGALCVVGFSLVAFGEAGGTVPATQVGNPQDKQTVAFRAATGTADSATNLDTILADATNCKEFPLNGRQNVTVMGVFSAAAQTCKVRVVYYTKDADGNKFDTNLSREKTITAGAYTRSESGTKYRSETESFDGMGAYFCKVILTQAPSSGTVSLRVGSY